MQSKTLTILMADIQGYTSRTSQQTREENELFIKEIHAFMEKHIQDHDGKLVKSMGDGFLVAFESPTNAVYCGQGIQRGIERRNANILDSDHFVKIRIGISTGEVNIDETGDIFGEAVNIAARIESFADPNGVFISESTYLAMNKSEIDAMDLGPQQFKNLMQVIRVYRILGDHDKMSPRETKERKRSIPLRYKYLGMGLSIGIFLAAIFMLILMLPLVKSTNQLEDEKPKIEEKESFPGVLEKKAMTYSQEQPSKPLMDRRSMGDVLLNTESPFTLSENEIMDLVIEVGILERFVVQNED